MLTSVVGIGLMVIGLVFIVRRIAGDGKGEFLGLKIEGPTGLVVAFFGVVIFLSPIAFNKSQPVTQPPTTVTAHKNQGEQQYDAATKAIVFVHYRSPSRKAVADAVAVALRNEGFFVPRIVLDIAVGNPGADVIYWNAHDGNEAATIGRILTTVASVASPRVVHRGTDADPNAESRRYEAWL